MYIKTLVASVIVSLILTGLAYFITVNLNYTANPALTYFILSLVAGLVTTLWVRKTPTSAVGSKPAKTPRQPRSARSVDAVVKGSVNGAAAVDAVAKETGSVKWFSPSKGFGFITRDNGEDIFVHFRSIMGDGHKVLREGQRVEFAVTEGSKGLQAEDVNKLR